MPMQWTHQSIQWFLDASKYTRFHKALAELIVPFLNEEDILCDLGCGLGRIDLSLAAHVKQITAIDINERVTDILRCDAEHQLVPNIDVLCGDGNEVGNCADVMLFSFFGHTDLRPYLVRSNRLFIRIANADNAGILYPAQDPKTKIAKIPMLKLEFEELGLPYHLYECAIEFGQPLRSTKDAWTYIRSHAPEATNDEVARFLNQRAILTGNEEFPIYIPNLKHMGIFIIDMASVAQNKYVYLHESAC